MKDQIKSKIESIINKMESSIKEGWMIEWPTEDDDISLMDFKEITPFAELGWIIDEEEAWQGLYFTISTDGDTDEDNPHELATQMDKHKYLLFAQMEEILFRYLINKGIDPQSYQFNFKYDMPALVELELIITDYHK